MSSSFRLVISRIRHPVSQYQGTFQCCTSMGCIKIPPAVVCNYCAWLSETIERHLFPFAVQWIVASRASRNNCHTIGRPGNYLFCVCNLCPISGPLFDPLQMANTALNLYLYILYFKHGSPPPGPQSCSVMLTLTYSSEYIPPTHPNSPRPTSPRQERDLQHVV